MLGFNVRFKASADFLHEALTCRSASTLFPVNLLFRIYRRHRQADLAGAAVVRQHVRGEMVFILLAVWAARVSCGRPSARC